MNLEIWMNSVVIHILFSNFWDSFHDLLRTSSWVWTLSRVFCTCWSFSLSSSSLRTFLTTSAVVVGAFSYFFSGCSFLYFSSCSFLIASSFFFWSSSFFFCSAIFLSSYCFRYSAERVCWSKFFLKASVYFSANLEYSTPFWKTCSSSFAWTPAPTLTVEASEVCTAFLAPSWPVVTSLPVAFFRPSRIASEIGDPLWGYP